MKKISLHEEINILNVHLKVANLTRSTDFYAGQLGFHLLNSDDRTAFLSLNEKDVNLILTELDNPVASPVKSTGLYHIAFLLPDRTQLALMFRHLYNSGVKFQGFADHGVSEALYLSDPDRNGVEIYSDRPKEYWKKNGAKIQMVSESLDIQGLLKELDGKDLNFKKIHPSTRIGHIHLKTSSLTNAERFYSGVLNFDITQSDYEGALFMSAGGYHHHIGFNTWMSKDGDKPLDNSIGMKSFTIEMPAFILNDTIQNLDEAGISYKYENNLSVGKILTRDLDGNVLELIFSSGVNHET